jgi:ergothioneine biosynthesis protein EgtB
MYTAVKPQLASSFQTVRSRTLELVAPLEIEDYVVQTAPFMSPPRWHIGHTTWFFEVVLRENLPGYKVFCEPYLYYFNSYYERFGSRIRKEQRGTKSRPTVEQTLAYRSYVDEAMVRLLDTMSRHRDSHRVETLTMLGLEHEMQHQELLVYDIKHLLCDLYNPRRAASPRQATSISGMAEVRGGLFELGFGDSGFAFDNEKRAHLVHLQDYAIDRAPVTNGEYLDFIKDGGYQDYRWWHTEGWSWVEKEGWEAPLYWERDGDEWLIRDFNGLFPIEQKSGDPVSHISFLEAAAYAKWAGKRLPTEAEWEKAASGIPGGSSKRKFPWGESNPDETLANLFENGLWSTAPVGSYPDGQSQHGCHQMIGDVWEWTSSDYVAYPGFKCEFDEYNDKWFVGQKVLRGGCYATPRSHIRTTYRNFFYPHERWMISGIRCARDL